MQKTVDNGLHIVSGGDDCSLAYSIVSVLDKSITKALTVKKVDAHSSSLKGESTIFRLRNTADEVIAL